MTGRGILDNLARKWATSCTHIGVASEWMAMGRGIYLMGVLMGDLQWGICLKQYMKMKMKMFENFSCQDQN